MSDLDNKIYSILKKAILTRENLRPPTRAEVAKFIKKRELLDALIRDEEQIHFGVKIHAETDIIVGRGPWGEYSHNDIEDLLRVKIQYSSRWSYS